MTGQNTDRPDLTRQQKLLQLAGNDIARDCTACKTLESLLEALHSALFNRVTAEVERLNGEVSRCMSEIAERAARRGKILQAFGTADPKSSNVKLTPAAMDSVLNRLPAERRGPVRKQWGELQEQLARCRKLNERNGRLLALQKDIFTQLKNRGDDNSGVYSREAY